MKFSFITIFLVLFWGHVFSQDVIEREYFEGARAKNAAIAAARYAEEGYYYTKFTTFISAIDSSRMFADTALFFVKRSLMLGDTSLHYAPVTNFPAVEYLKSGKEKAMIADTVIREFYPMVELESHHYFGTEASLHLSNSVMDFFNASLLLRGDTDLPDSEKQQYEVLPFDDEVIRLEADEAAFQQAANAYEREIDEMVRLESDLKEKLRLATPGTPVAQRLEDYVEDIGNQIEGATSRLQDASFRIQEIRLLLNSKYLADVKGAEDPEHISKFEKKETGEIKMDEAVPDGLVYKIQLGYYPSNVDVNNFQGLFPITGETVKQGLARFYAGVFFSYADASEGSEYIRNNVIANAFVVPFFNGEKVSMSRAVEIERQRGME